jgi:cytochrome c peroxidase
MKISVLLVMLGLPFAASAGEDSALRGQAKQLFGRLEAPSAKVIATPEVALGRALFWDTRISTDGKTACASCHPVEDFGADRRRASVDARGALTSRHSPTVFNSMPQPSIRWLGDRKDGADQAEGSMTGSMGFPTKDAAPRSRTWAASR